MSSAFKAYMAGVGTVAVAIALGFGGGYLIAERFGSDTAVPEQSKIAKAKQQDKKQAEAPQVPAIKPVVTQTIDAVNGHPQPSPQDFAPVVSVPPVSTNQQAANRPTGGPASTAVNQPTVNMQAANPIEVQPPREEMREAIPTAERQATPQVAPAEPRQPEVREPVAATQPQRKNERPPLRLERKQTARQQETAPKPDGRRQNQNQNQTMPGQNAVETDGLATRDSVGQDISANSETRPNAKRSRQMRAEERRQSRNVQTRDVEVEEEEQELSESAEVTTEYRWPQIGLPFLGLFGR